MKRSTLTFLSCLSLAGLYACGGSQAQPAAPDAEKEVEAIELPDSWEKGMTEKQEVAFMQQRVMTGMASVFGGEGEDHAKFACTTCHGPNYKDPQEFLPSLTLENGQITSFAEEPEESKFMAEKVVPAMAKAMGLPPYDVATGEGFGCGGCHAIEVK